MSSDGITPSSPAALFSDHTTVPSSPPSSPPGFPWEQDYAGAKPEPNTRTSSAFTVLGKRKALGDTSNNVRPAKKASTPSTKAPKVAMTQMQLSLGQEVRKRCKTCGMEYTLSSAEDRTLHDKYHKQNTEGFDVGKDFVRKTEPDELFAGLKKGDAICRVSPNEYKRRRARCQAVLEIAQRELGGVPIDETSLWGASEAALRHNSYLYLRGTRCVGYLLVEHISGVREARAVVRPTGRFSESVGSDKTTDDKKHGAAVTLSERRKATAEAIAEAEASPLELSPCSGEADLGISRIWTSSAHRRQNIATALLDAALGDQGRTLQTDPTPWNGLTEPKYGPMRNLRKDMVAFSQPTQSGARLARKWTGKVYGWKVYVD